MVFSDINVTQLLLSIVVELIENVYFYIKLQVISKDYLYE